MEVKQMLQHCENMQRKFDQVAPPAAGSLSLKGFW